MLRGKADETDTAVHEGKAGEGEEVEGDGAEGEDKKGEVVREIR